MQPVTVTFERIFDVRQGYLGIRGMRTTFGFENSRMRKEEACVRGFPEFRNGMTVTLLLGRNDDWRTIIGWVDHANGEVTAPSMIPPVATLIIAGCVILFCVFALPAADHRVVSPGLLPLFAILILNAWAACRWFKARQMLNAQAAAMKQADG
ncbi:MAG: hypothetical protein JWN73_3609 [Betaproteobacteria bacterium]|nr:hypothetical protein [Betaproteobacteria bacterium]